MAISLPIPSAAQAARTLSTGTAAGTLAAMLLGGAGLLLYLTSTVAASGYENARLIEQKRFMEHQTQALEAEVASLRSLEHVDGEARSQLGMVGATSYIYVQVDPRLKDQR